MNNTSKENKTCAVIPFYNEFNTIDIIIDETLKYTDYVVAVNDGSNDLSESKVRKDERIILIQNEINSGKGYSLKRGLEECIKRGFQTIITLDADLQHNPESIPFLISYLDNFDIVIGNRLNHLKSMPFHRILSNKITSFLLSKKTKLKILDGQCGFRAFRGNILKYILPSSNGYEAESEMIILSSRNNYKIGFLEIPTIYSNEKSKMKSIKTIIGFIKILFI